MFGRPGKNADGGVTLSDIAGFLEIHLTALLSFSVSRLTTPVLYLALQVGHRDSD